MLNHFLADGRHFAKERFERYQNAKCDTNAPHSQQEGLNFTNQSHSQMDQLANSLSHSSLSEQGAQSKWFLAGACVGATPRLMRLPKRKFTTYDHSVQIDPIEYMASQGMNAIRVSTRMGQSVGPTKKVNNDGDWHARELNFQLDLGGVDVQVDLAVQAKSLGMKVVHTITIGQEIPGHWEEYSYVEMLDALQGETQRQLKPFLDKGVQPDIILLGNEATDGMLSRVSLPGGDFRFRGIKNDKVTPKVLKKELCGEIPHGNIASYPLLAGMYKHQILSTRKYLAESYRMDPVLTRFGLHSHGQYFIWKNGEVYRGDDNSRETRIEIDGEVCTFEDVIPSHLCGLRACDLLDIMGFSGYPDPLKPKDLSDEALTATFHRLKDSIGAMRPFVERYGRHESGPYSGQYRKQALIVEWASNFKYPQDSARQQDHMKMFFDLVKREEWFLGALYWEPHYGHNNWEGGQGSLCRPVTKDGSTMGPVPALATWGSFADSPNGQCQPRMRTFPPGP